jgi:hypothetical protein
MRRRMGTILLAAACGLALPAASAGTAHAADDKAMKDASDRFEEGLKRVKAGDFEAARLAFVQAHAILNRVDILWNLAVVEEKSGHTLDALAHFKQYVRDTRVIAKERAQAEKHVSALAAQTGHIEVTAPSGASIIVDGSANAGTTPLLEPVDVAPGKHKIEARTTERQYALDVVATAGDVVKANFTSQFAAPLPAVAPSPSVNATPGISPGGASDANTASTSSGITPPSDVDTGRAATTSSSGTFWTPKHITVVSLGGAAVIAVGLGIYFAIDAGSTNDSATTIRSGIGPGTDVCASGTNPSCAQLRDLKSTYDTDKTLETVGFVAGGVLAVGAVATWFLWKDAPSNSETAGANKSENKSEKTSGAWFVPSVSPHSAGASVVGRF